jgi:glycosyltransferase involved in cell wall biosynthesis
MGELRRECETVGYDCVYCDHLSMFEYGRRLGLPVVYDAHNVEFEILRRHTIALGYSPLRIPVEVEWRRVKAYEQRAVSASSLVFAVSEEDKAALARLVAAPPNVAVVPISIDLSGKPRIGPLTTDPEVLFVGGLHWPPNRDAVRYFIGEIWPAVLQAVPQARLTVVGRGEADGATRSARNVRFAGYVDDVEPFFQCSRLLVVPLRSGSGMRVKILDAFARGLPVVSTSIGCEGLDAEPGADLALADSPAEFAQAVVEILRQDPLANALRTHARRLVEERFQSSVVERAVLASMRGFGQRTARTA